MSDSVRGEGSSEQRHPDENVPVFIVGVTRSGTTLFQNILNRHQRLSIYSESHFIRFVCPHSPHARVEVEDLDEVLNRVRHLEREGVSRDVIRDRFSSSGGSARDLFDAILRLRMEKRGKRRMGEKTPSHFWFIDTLMQWYPHAKIVFMMRDPRDAHASFKKSRSAQGNKKVDRAAIGRALYWNQGAKALVDGLRQYPGQVFKVEFEQLVQEPGMVVRSVCDFLGESYDDRMIDVTSTNSSFEATKSKPGFRREVLNRKVGLGRVELFLLELICSRRMIENGYTPLKMPSRLISILDSLGFYERVESMHTAIRNLRSGYPRA